MLMLLLILSQLAGQPRLMDYMKSLTTCADMMGYSVEVTEMPDGYFVVGNSAERHIIVNGRLSENGRIGALAYQLAYIQRPYGLSANDADAFSELAARRVLVLLDLPTGDSDKYLERFPDRAMLAKAQQLTIGATAGAIHGCVVAAGDTQ